MGQVKFYKSGNVWLYNEGIDSSVDKTVPPGNYRRSADGTKISIRSKENNLSLFSPKYIEVTEIQKSATPSDNYTDLVEFFTATDPFFAGLSTSLIDENGNPINGANPLPSYDIDKAQRISGNTVFGDNIGGIRKSSIAAQFQYSIEGGTSDSELLNGGAISIFESLLIISSGIDIAGRARINSTENVRYVPGQELYMYWTSVFTTPKENSYQRSGLFDDNNGFFAGYEGTVFTFTRRRGGIDFPQTIDLLAFHEREGYSLDPTKGNVYKISYGYLGFAPITLEVMKPSGELVLLDRIEYPNSATVTHTTQTFLPVRGEVGNSGNNTDMVMSVGSLAAGIVNGGNEDIAGRQFAWSNIIPVALSGANTELVTFRNKTIFAGINNKVPARLLFISGAVENNKNVRWKLFKDVPKKLWKYFVGFHTDSIISEVKLPLQIDDKLGNWSLDYEGAGVVIKTGIYQIGDKIRRRGFKGAKIDWIKLLKEHKKENNISYERLKVLKIDPKEVTPEQLKNRWG